MRLRQLTISWCVPAIILSLLVHALPGSAAAQSIITTVAGGGPPNAASAVAVGIPRPTGLAKDTLGNVYFISSDAGQIYRTDTSGHLSLIAGNCINGLVDNVPALGACLQQAEGIAIDNGNNLFIADGSRNLIRRIDSGTGLITTVAGKIGNFSFSGDGGPATAAGLGQPQGVAVDSTGNIFIADTFSQRVRRVDASTGIIATVAGNGVAGFNGDGIAATNAQLNFPAAVAVDSAGDLFIADASNSRIRRVDGSTGLISTIANTTGSPSGVAVDSTGNIYFSDLAGSLIHRIDAHTLAITTVAGNGVAGYNGDGKPAIAASLNLTFPVSGIFVDSAGNLFITDTNNFRIRAVTAATGIINTITGDGSPGDGGPATDASLGTPEDVAIDSLNNLFIADQNNARIRRVDNANGVITTVAGGASIGITSGDGGPATSASLAGPAGIVIDKAGDILIADAGVVRRVDSATKIITTVAGTPNQFGFSGDGGPATKATLSCCMLAIRLDSHGNLFITDENNNRIRRVDAITGIIATVAGDGIAGFNGDDIAATAANLNMPFSIALDASDNLFIADTLNQRIRRVDAVSGLISTVAGNGTIGIFGSNGDGGAATAASLNNPEGLAFDGSGNLFISEFAGDIRRVDAATNTISTPVGRGQCCFGGDGGPATGAVLDGPRDLTIDSSGNLFIADTLNNRIRKVEGLGSPGGITPGTFLGPPNTPMNPTASFAEPVNTATGNYYTSHDDLGVRGRGMSFDFVRYYNSLDSGFTGPLGFGWTHSFNILLTDNKVIGIVTVKRSNGSIVTFSPTGAGSFKPSTIGLFDNLLKNDDNSFTLVQRDQTRLNFLQSGKLSSIVDRNGNTQTLTYNTLGELIKVRDTVGRSFNFSYDNAGRLVLLTDPAGRSMHYSYNSDGNLISYQDPAGGITRYAYDNSHRMTSATDARGVVYLENTYDQQGRVVVQKNGRSFATRFAYDTPSTGITTITDGRGNITRHIYDNFPRLIKILDAEGGSTSFTYDANNNRNSVTDPNGKTTAFSYDARGNLTSSTDAAANTTTLTYDIRNNLLTTKDRNGNTTSFSYDNRGNLSSIQNALGGATTFEYDGFGQVISRIDALGNKTSERYDTLGNLIEITNGAGNAIILRYDGISRLVSFTDGKGNITTIKYDALSRRTRTVDPIHNKTEFDYDAVGNLLKITDGNGNTTGYEYDMTNNLVKVRDALGQVTRYSYDANNNRISVKDANGHRTSYTYDSLNRRIRVTDPLSFARGYDFDPAGRVVSFKDAKGQVTKYTYNSVGRLAMITYADGTVVTYAYDANGNRISMVDPHGATTYAYDALNQLTSVTFPEGKIIRYAYNGLGKRLRLTYPDGKIVRYEYDAANRMSAVTDWLGRTTSYRYDAVGNLIDITYPNHTATALGYDPANRLIQVQNFLIRPGDEDDSHPVTTFRYKLDAVGNRLVVINGRDKLTRFSYDRLNRLISAGSEDAEDTEQRATSYTYDAVGNRLTTVKNRTTLYSYDADDRLIAANSAVFSYDANGNQISATWTRNDPLTYQYNAADRLIAVTGRHLKQFFAYDGDGNRISQSTGDRRSSYLNDITSALPVVLQEEVSDGTIKYLYGRNRISESGSGFDVFFQYDGLGSVVGLTNVVGELERTFKYDAWGASTADWAHKKIGVVRDSFRFTGEALNAGTELYYLRARYYDPRLGRFISRDQFFGSADVPQTLNRYSYSRNNPATLVDHSGFAAEPISHEIASSAAVLPSLLSSSFAPVPISGISGVFSAPLPEIPPPAVVPVTSRPVAITNDCNNPYDPTCGPPSPPPGPPYTNCDPDNPLSPCYPRDLRTKVPRSTNDMLNTYHPWVIDDPWSIDSWSIDPWGIDELWSTNNLWTTFDPWDFGDF